MAYKMKKAMSAMGHTPVKGVKTGAKKKMYPANGMMHTKPSVRRSKG